jgi:FAD/FMN-containing dehydrogenase
MSAVEVAGLDGGLVPITTDELAELVDGPVLLPGGPGWPEAVRLWNGLVGKVPAVAVRPTRTRDVTGIVRLARDRGLALGVKAGGHNIAGTAIAEGGLLMDLGKMRAVTVDPLRRLADVGPGCRLGDVDRATQEHGLSTVLGFVSEVGVAGLTLGGGLGYLTRRFGWTVDNLEEVEVVTADGSVRVANREENSDLFWALRGAGANFGVVTRFTFRLHEVGPIVYGGLIAWPFERADEVLRAYRSITAQAPRELAVWLVLLEAPPAPFVPEGWRGRRLCAMAVCYSGDLGSADDVLAPVRLLADPVVDLLAEQPYCQVQSYLDGTEPSGMHHYWKTEFLADLDDELLAELQARFSRSPLPGTEIGLLHLAGAVNDRPADDGAVGNRDARYALGFKAMWPPGSPGEQLRQWVRDSWQATRRFSTGGNYVNFQAADEDEERVRSMYGPNHPRLVELKKVYDPDNLFRANRNIRPCGAPSGPAPARTFPAGCRRCHHDRVPDLADLLGDVARRAADYRMTVAGRAVVPGVEAAGSVRAALDGLREEPTDPSVVVEELVAAISPGLVASAGPRYFGYVIGGALHSATAADMLAAGWDQCAFNATSPRPRPWWRRSSGTG